MIKRIVLFIKRVLGIEEVHLTEAHYMDSSTKEFLIVICDSLHRHYAFYNVNVYSVPELRRWIPMNYRSNIRGVNVRKKSNIIRIKDKVINKTIEKSIFLKSKMERTNVIV